MTKPVPPVITKPTVSPLEKESEKRLIRKVRTAGGVSWKFVSPNNRGVSDRIVLFFGRVIFVEMKREGNDLTPKQRQFRQRVIDNCGEFATVVGHDGVDKFVQELIDHAPWYAKVLASYRLIVTRITGKYD